VRRGKRILLFLQLWCCMIFLFISCWIRDPVGWCRIWGEPPKGENLLFYDFYPLEVSLVSSWALRGVDGSWFGKGGMEGVSPWALGVVGAPDEVTMRVNEPVQGFFYPHDSVFIGENRYRDSIVSYRDRIVFRYGERILWCYRGRFSYLLDSTAYGPGEVFLPARGPWSERLFPGEVGVFVGVTEVERVVRESFYFQDRFGVGFREVGVVTGEVDGEPVTMVVGESEGEVGVVAGRVGGFLEEGFGYQAVLVPFERGEFAFVLVRPLGVRMGEFWRWVLGGGWWEVWERLQGGSERIRVQILFWELEGVWDIGWSLWRRGEERVFYPPEVSEPGYPYYLGGWYQWVWVHVDRYGFRGMALDVIGVRNKRKTRAVTLPQAPPEGGVLRWGSPLVWYVLHIPTRWLLFIGKLGGE